jgi:hypothetical protein
MSIVDMQRALLFAEEVQGRMRANQFVRLTARVRGSELIDIGVKS